MSFVNNSNIDSQRTPQEYQSRFETTKLDPREDVVTTVVPTTGYYPTRTYRSVQTSTVDPTISVTRNTQSRRSSDRTTTNKPPNELSQDSLDSFHTSGPPDQNFNRIVGKAVLDNGSRSMFRRSKFPPFTLNGGLPSRSYSIMFLDRCLSLSLNTGKKR